jgi:hypothetical protein
MLNPFSSDDDVSVLVQEYFNPLHADEMRVKIHAREGGGMVITAPGMMEPMLTAPGQEIVIDMSLEARVSAIAKFTIFRVTSKKGVRR